MRIWIAIVSHIVHQTAHPKDSYFILFNLKTKPERVEGDVSYFAAQRKMSLPSFHGNDSRRSGVAFNHICFNYGLKI